ncbi:MAG: hypothetical protein ACYC2U_07265 [Candidatus Amoebophilus sp.]
MHAARDGCRDAHPQPAEGDADTNDACKKRPKLASTCTTKASKGEALPDEDALQQPRTQRARTAKRRAAAHNSPCQRQAAQRRRDAQPKTRKNADDSSSDLNLALASEDEEESRKRKKAVKKVTKTAAKKATKAPAKRKRKSEESVRNDVDEEEQAGPSDDKEAMDTHKAKSDRLKAKRTCTKATYNKDNNDGDGATAAGKQHSRRRAKATA